MGKTQHIAAESSEDNVGVKSKRKMLYGNDAQLQQWVLVWSHLIPLTYFPYELLLFYSDVSEIQKSLPASML